MMKVFDSIILCAGIMFFTSISIRSQENQFLQRFDAKKNFKTENVILGEIEKGILKGDVSKIARYFSSQTYLSFSNGINGYYSSNQAYYVLEEFFNLFSVITFNFNYTKSEENISYASGSYFYERRGKRDSAQVYVILNKTGNNWFIAQISIN